MSWSFSAVGRPNAVAQKLRVEAETTRCAGAEETARKAVLEQASLLCENGFSSDNAVRVAASGSAYTQGDGSQSYNSLDLKIEPLYGFVE